MMESLAVFLVVLILNGPGNGYSFNYHEMPSLEACYQVIEKSKTDIAKGGDAEMGVALYRARDKASYSDAKRK